MDVSVRLPRTEAARRLIFRKIVVSFWSEKSLEKVSLPILAGMTSLEEESAVDRRMDESVRNQLQGIQGWRGMNNPWMPEDDGDIDFAYINLLENVERYTGYKVGLALPFISCPFFAPFRSLHSPQNGPHPQLCL